MNPKNLAKRTVAVIMILAFLCSSFVFTVSAAEVCPEIYGSNQGWHDYFYNIPDRCFSFLIETENGEFMRFQNDAIEDAYLAEYFDSDFSLKSHKYIQTELPIFGGFYAGENYYFVVSGQENHQESPETECFRITKYDRNWNRIGSAGLYDCNTTVPFDAGMVRFAECGKYLLVRTAHEMYTSSDGLNHQANVTIQLDTENMVITDSAPYVANSGAGYASHSFNQFIHVEDRKIIALDHGDAYPRSIVLTKSVSDISSGSFGYYCNEINVLDIPGAIGNNFTGVQVGGFEISSNSYLVAYNAIDFNELDMNADSMWNNWSLYTGNVFVASVDKSTDEVKIRQFTDFEFGEKQDGDPGNPFLVKISDNKFALLWQEGDNVRYTFLNAFGEASSRVYTLENSYLSDCQPIVSGDKVIWYTHTDNNVNFYGISVSAPENTFKTQVYDGHGFEVSRYPSATGGDCTITCRRCGLSETFKTGEGFTAYWRIGTSEDGYFSSYLESTNFKVGDSLSVYFDEYDYSAEHTEKSITVSRPDAVSITQEENYWDEVYNLTFLKAGTVTINVSYKYNPAISQSYTFKVYESGDSIPGIDEDNSNAGGDNSDNSQEENNGCAHSFSIIASATTPGGDCVGKCDKCGYVKNIKTGSYISDFWRTDEDAEGYYYSPISKTGFKVGDSISAMFEDGEYGIEFNEKIVIVSDESGVSMSKDNSCIGDVYNFEFLKTGKYTITVYYKYNPSVSKSVSVTVFGENDGDINKNGRIDSMDYLYLKRAYFDQYPIPENEIGMTDLDKNGKLDSMDYLYLKRAYFSAYDLG